MAHKHFSMLISIIFSVTILMACAKPLASVSTQLNTETRFQLTKTQLKSSESVTVDTEPILAQPIVPSGLAATTHTVLSDINPSQLPLYFVENKGQVDSSVAYYILGGSTKIYFTEDGVTFVFIKTENSSPRDIHTVPPPLQWVVKMDFVNANSVQPDGVSQTDTIVSYFKGTSDHWRSGLSTYTQIIYHDLWKGIDLVYYGQSGKLSYDFLVHPGADPAQIQIRYRGTESVNLNPSGQMMVSTPLGGFVDDAPVAWQVENNLQTPITATYKLHVGSNTVGNQTNNTYGEHGTADQVVSYGFGLAGYDRTQTMVIDPAIFISCGYIGGSGHDEGTMVALDGSGNTYITGGTWSTEASFPVTVGPDLTYNGGWDVFVAKVNSSGKALVYAGYIGGSANEYGRDIAVDSNGNAYVTGFTESDQNSFPVKGGPDLTYNLNRDAFIAKLSPAGDALVYAGYIGGVMVDEGNGIAVDGAGNAYISGSTASPEDTFPVKVGPDLSFNGTTDAFIAKVNPSGTALDYAGYIGGSGWEWGMDIALDSTGDAYIVGTTDSPNFPAIVGPDSSFNGGLYDAFVAKVNASGTALVYAGYVGGSGEDKGWGIAVDNAGNAYITGETASNQSSFPVVNGPDLTYNGGDKDAFVAKVNKGGTALVYAGYIGGLSIDIGYNIAVDGVGEAYIVGFTSSDQASFPLTQGPDLTYNGGLYDGFVTKVSDSGTQLIFSGYIGGLGDDYGIGIAVDSAGNAYVSGTTASDQSTFPLIGGPDLSYNGGDCDAFIAKVSLVPGNLFLPINMK